MSAALAMSQPVSQGFKIEAEIRGACRVANQGQGFFEADVGGACDVISEGDVFFLVEAKKRRAPVITARGQGFCRSRNHPRCRYLPTKPIFFFEAKGSRVPVVAASKPKSLPKMHLYLLQAGGSTMS